MTKRNGNVLTTNGKRRNNVVKCLDNGKRASDKRSGHVKSTWKAVMQMAERTLRTLRGHYVGVDSALWERQRNTVKTWNARGENVG